MGSPPATSWSAALNARSPVQHRLARPTRRAHQTAALVVASPGSDSGSRLDARARELDLVRSMAKSEDLASEPTAEDFNAWRSATGHRTPESSRYPSSAGLAGIQNGGLTPR